MQQWQFWAELGVLAAVGYLQLLIGKQKSESGPLINRVKVIFQE